VGAAVVAAASGAAVAACGGLMPAEADFLGGSTAAATVDAVGALVLTEGPHTTPLDTAAYDGSVKKALDLERLRETRESAKPASSIKRKWEGKGRRRGVGGLENP